MSTLALYKSYVRLIIGSVVSIDVSLPEIWNNWYRFRRGKKSSHELEKFQYHLEANLFALYKDIQQHTYAHGEYRKFIVADNKRREISVSCIRDRVLHRLLYEYLIERYDKTFIYDIWSCRKGKGLTKAIARAQQFMTRYRRLYIWRSDVTKFFDNVVHTKLLEILQRKPHDPMALYLLTEVIASYQVSENAWGRKGIPIGNLTSQVFSNIYLNEFDRFISHTIKPLAYMRYGDDFIVIMENKAALEDARKRGTTFLKEVLDLSVNPKNDIIIRIKQGIYFLGVEIFPSGRRLRKRNWHRASTRVNARNIGSYWGLVSQHSTVRQQKQFDWILAETIFNEL